MDHTEAFEAERTRLTRIASSILNDQSEAEDIVQQVWLRLDRADTDIESLPAWVTTVTSRLCLDRLKARIPIPTDESPLLHPAPDPADDIALAETVGIALQVVLDRLTPQERVAFVLHESFGFEHSTIAAVLDSTPGAARKLASRARAKIAQPAPEDPLAQWEVVDAFMAAAREGDFDRLLRLLAPGADVVADHAAISAGTPDRIEGSNEVATFFNGSAHAALPVLIGDRAGYAWFRRGVANVLFDFTVRDGVVCRITFRAAPEVLAKVVRRDGREPRDSPRG